MDNIFNTLFGKGSDKPSKAGRTSEQTKQRKEAAEGVRRILHSLELQHDVFMIITQMVATPKDMEVLDNGRVDDRNDLSSEVQHIAQAHGFHHEYQREMEELLKELEA